jgi:hypothetical protein
MLRINNVALSRWAEWIVDCPPGMVDPPTDCFRSQRLRIVSRTSFTSAHAVFVPRAD